MTDMVLQASKLFAKHLTEWRALITTDVKAWQQLRIRHRQAITEAGFLNFTDWNHQRKEIYELGVAQSSVRIELKKRHHTEQEMVSILLRGA